MDRSIYRKNNKYNTPVLFWPGVQQDRGTPHLGMRYPNMELEFPPPKTGVLSPIWNWGIPALD